MSNPQLDGVIDGFDPFALAAPVRDGDGRIVDFRVELANRSAAAEFGIPGGRLDGTRLMGLGHEERANDLLGRLVHLVETHQPFTEDLGWAGAEPGRSLVVRFDSLGDLVLVRGYDARSDRGIALREVSAAESRFRILAELCADFVIEATTDGVITWISPGIFELTGRTPESLIGQPSRILWDPADVADRTEFYTQLRTNGRATHNQRIAHIDGSSRWTKVATRAVIDGDGVVTGYIGSGIDIQAEIDARNALAASEERFRLIAELASDIVMRFDEADVVQWVSPSVTAVLGWTPEQVVGTSIAELIHPSEVSRVPYVDARTAHGASVSFESRLRTVDGAYRWFDVSVRPVMDGNGRVTGHVSGLHDIDDAVRARTELAYQATHDALTHVANRADLYAHIDELLGHQPRTGDRVGVLFLDVDRLKSVNDTYGHAAGDAVLVAVADRIRGAVRANDVVARFGGDEFVVILASLHGIEDAERIAEKIHATMATPVAAREHAISVSVSIGIALADADTEPDITLQHADAALYRAKARGRGKTAAHRPDA